MLGARPARQGCSRSQPGLARQSTHQLPTGFFGITMEVLMTQITRKGSEVSKHQRIARRQFLSFLAGSPLLTASTAGAIASLLAASVAFSCFESYRLHSWAPRSGGPEIRNHRPRVWITESRPSAAPRNDELIGCDRFHRIDVLARIQCAHRATTCCAPLEERSARTASSPLRRMCPGRVRVRAGGEEGSAQPERAGALGLP